MLERLRNDKRHSDNNHQDRVRIFLGMNKKHQLGTQESARESKAIKYD